VPLAFADGGPVAQTKKTEVREAILKSAYRLFKRKGYVATTTAQVAAGAHIAEANLYNYFDSKFDILSHLFEPWLRARIARLEGAVARVPEPRARLRRLLEALWRDLPREDNGFTNNLMQALSTLGRPDRYRPELLAWVEARIEAMIKDAVPPARYRKLAASGFAHVLMMAYDGFVMQAHLAPERVCPDATIEAMCDLILGKDGARP